MVIWIVVRFTEQDERGWDKGGEQFCALNESGFSDIPDTANQRVLTVMFGAP
jgi:hypothetical protein